MRRNERGSATLEFAIVFPCQLFVVLFLIQLALTCGADQVVQYAAYSAARSGLVDRSEESAPLAPEQAAEKAAEVATLALTWAPLARATDRQGFVEEVTSEAGSQYARAQGLTNTVSVHNGDLWTDSVEHHYQRLIPGLDAFLDPKTGDYTFLASSPEPAMNMSGGGG